VRVDVWNSLGVLSGRHANVIDQVPWI
jgi:hypothetical protein